MSDGRMLVSGQAQIVHAYMYVRHSAYHLPEEANVGMRDSASSLKMVESLVLSLTMPAALSRRNSSSYSPTFMTYETSEELEGSSDSRPSCSRENEKLL